MNNMYLEINSFIGTPDGWIRAKNVHKERNFILGPSVDNDQAYNGVIEEVPGYRVSLSNGQIFKCTDNLHVLIMDNLTGGYLKPISECKEDELLGVIKEHIFAQDYKKFILKGRRSRYNDGSIVFDEGLAYLMGLYLGDGCLTGRSWKRATFIFVTNKDNTDFIINVIQPLLRFGNRTKRGKKVRVQETKNYDLLFLNNAVFGNWVEQWFGTNKDKRVPDFIFESPRSVVENFLAGLMDADGGYSKTGSATFWNSNIEIVREVANVLAFLGIEARFSKRKQKYKYKDGREGFLYALHFYSIYNLPLRVNKKKARQLLRKEGKSGRWYIDRECVDKKYRKWSGGNHALYYYLKGQCKYVREHVLSDLGTDHYKYFPVKILKIEKIEKIKALILSSDSQWCIGDGRIYNGL